MFLRKISVIIFILMLYLMGGAEDSIALEGSNRLVLPQPEINHQAPSSFTRNGEIVLEASSSDSFKIVSVRCYFRLPPDRELYHLEMEEKEQNQYSCSFPVFLSSISTVEYFFIFVNEKQQVVRSENHTIIKDRKDIFLESSSNRNRSIHKPPCSIFTESKYAYINASKFFIQDHYVVDLVSPIRYLAHRVGELRKEDCFGELRKGYFGGFLLNDSGVLSPIPGYMCISKELATAIENKITMIQDSSVKALSEKGTEPSEIMIDVHGDNWAGEHYRTDMTWFKPSITANVFQENENVTIDTTEVEGFFPSHHLVGTISATGDMVMIDSRDGEIWTTYYGPADEFSIVLADWVDIWEEDNPSPALYVVDITRDAVLEDADIPLPGIQLLLL